MFENAGEKLEKWANALFWINTVAIIIFAVILMAIYGKAFVYMGFGIEFLILAIVVALLIIIQYVLCLALAGFGQLISNTAKSASESKRIASNVADSAPKAHEAAIVNNAVVSDELPDL